MRISFCSVANPLRCSKASVAEFAELVDLDNFALFVSLDCRAKLLQHSNGRIGITNWNRRLVVRLHWPTWRTVFRLNAGIGVSG